MLSWAFKLRNIYARVYKLMSIMKKQIGGYSNVPERNINDCGGAETKRGGHAALFATYAETHWTNFLSPRRMTRFH